MTQQSWNKIKPSQHGQQENQTCISSSERNRYSKSKHGIKAEPASSEHQRTEMGARCGTSELGLVKKSEIVRLHRP